MVNARLHLICGNCGCGDDFETKRDGYGQDYAGRTLETVYVVCRNCATRHDLEDNAPGAHRPIRGDL